MEWELPYAPRADCDLQKGVLPRRQEGSIIVPTTSVAHGTRISCPCQVSEKDPDSQTTWGGRRIHATVT